jgi:peptide/nickel transport system permease protein
MTVPSQELIGTVTAESGVQGQTPLDDTRVPSRARVVLRRFLRHKGALFGLVLLLLLVFMAYVGIHFTRYKYDEPDFTAFLKGPMTTGSKGAHWFGTDETGTDIYAATMRGAQKSILIGLFVAMLATGTAAVVGASAGYFGGVVDKVLMWFVDLLLVIPGFLIIAILSPKFHGSTWLFVLLLGMFIWQITARIVRAQTLSLREREYVLSAKYMAVPAWKIILRHVLPNLASLLIIDATINVATAVLTETGLSFLGFGIQAPDVSLGTLIKNAETSATTQPWLFLFPGGFLVLLLLAVNLVGSGLRDALDPNAGRAT